MWDNIPISVEMKMMTNEKIGTPQDFWPEVIMP
jgi:hypothetical protein